MQVFSPENLLKEALAQVFSCEYCKIFKNTCFEEHLWTSERFATWATNITGKIGSEDDFFFKNKAKKLF